MKKNQNSTLHNILIFNLITNYHKEFKYEKKIK